MQDISGIGTLDIEFSNHKLTENRRKNIEWILQLAGLRINQGFIIYCMTFGLVYSCNHHNKCCDFALNSGKLKVV